MIAPRLTTPVTPAGGRATTRLPDDMVSEQVQRLTLFSAIGAGLWTFGLAMESFLIPLTIGQTVNRRGITIEVFAIATSVAIFLYVRFANRAPQTKIDAGLWYMLFNAIGVALLNTWAIEPTRTTMSRLSWNTIVILVSSMVMSSSPRKMLAASMAAASMDPLGVWIAHLRGLPVPSPLDTVVLYLPNYACAIVAILPSHLFNRLGRRLREAQELGSYQLVELLGHGGMGEVWRAKHRLLARNAAVKLVRPELLGVGSGSEAQLLVRRFEREAQATAALSSPNSIRLFDFGVTEEGTFYYVMELLAGRDLESLVRTFGPAPAERAIYLLRQVCHSLAEAHARGLVHRDVKPANIYVCRMGLDYDCVKVLDFGLVKFRKRDASDTLMTSDHTTTGTPAYMAPETILGQRDVDRRADVYALGCVAYFLLTGQLVFEGKTAMETLIQHVQSRPVPPSERAELPIPRQLDDVVLACLEKDPDKRPQDAEELFRLMQGCKACEGWSSHRAKAWWEIHLPELSGALTVVEDVTRVAAAETR